MGKTCSKLLGLDLLWTEENKLPAYFVLIGGQRRLLGSGHTGRQSLERDIDGLPIIPAPRDRQPAGFHTCVWQKIAIQPCTFSDPSPFFDTIDL